MLSRSVTATNYPRLIKNWHAKASENAYFSKFVFEYLAFIAYLKTEKYVGYSKDRDAIQSLKRDDSVKKAYLSKIESITELKDAWAKIKKELDNQPLGNASQNGVEEIKWWNCSHDDLNQKKPDENQKPKGIIHSMVDWENMVEFWYTIRNNLFHGAKNPEVIRDQFVVEYGYKTLRVLMEQLLENG